MAYVVNVAPKVVQLPYLPLSICLAKPEEEAVLTDYSEEDFETLYVLMRDVIEEGQTYPQDSMDKEHFRNYYLAGRTFVMKSKSGDFVGAFYVKPNFPGRSAHICNAGFVVHPTYRGRGALQVLTKAYLRIAKDLGYTGSFFNLVYVSNVAALHVYKKLGFRQAGLIPKAGDLKGLGLVDAAQFYYDLTTLDKDGLPPAEKSSPVFSSIIKNIIMYSWTISLVNFVVRQHFPHVFSSKNGSQRVCG